MAIPNSCQCNNQFAFLYGKPYSIFVELHLHLITYFIHYTMKEKVLKSRKFSSYFWGTCEVLNSYHTGFFLQEKKFACSATDAFRINTHWQTRIETFAKGPSCFLNSSKWYDFLLNLHICYSKSIILLLRNAKQSWWCHPIPSRWGSYHPIC